MKSTILLESEDAEAIDCVIDMVKLSLVVKQKIVKFEVQNED